MKVSARGRPSCAAPEREALLPDEMNMTLSESTLSSASQTFHSEDNRLFMERECSGSATVYSALFRKTARILTTTERTSKTARSRKEPQGPFAIHASSVVVSTMFVQTGVGTALLGATLPAFLAHWQLNDRAGGRLLFLAWLGAALGALLSRGNLARSVLRGVLLTTVACSGLAFASRVSVFPLIFVYGLGLGIVMTSISRLRAERSQQRSTQELNRLNLLWAAGALACPPMAAHALHTSRAAYLFIAFGAALLVLGGCMAALESRLPPVLLRNSYNGRLPPAPLFFCLISTLAVGIEAALGGWLTTYVKRADHSVAGAVTATSAFWAGLLLSRALHSTRLLGRFSPVAVLRWHSWIVASGLVLLLLLHQPWALVAFPVVLGFGLGPLYPLLLALVVPRHRGNRVFFAAGLGSAAVPWLTGALSSRAGSLRAGLLVPCAAACLLVLLVAGVLRAWEREHISVL